jgi:RimJ/RimL family protein N-acetyltransferase
VLQFRAEYVPLDTDMPGWGAVALMPWDAEVFGFPVADFRPGDPGEIGAHRPAFEQRLTRWAGQRQVEIVSCRHSGSDVVLSALLDHCGFRFVEASLRAELAPLLADRLPAARVTVRPAAPEDRGPLLEIAESAFDSGRYHADPRVPRALAGARYRFWLDNALSRPGPGTRVFALGAAGHPKGFFHVEVEAEEADLRLSAVDPAGNPGIAGFALYAGVLQALSAEGVRRVSARLTATNTAVVNLYASFGFRFADPEIVRHWHAANAPHLAPVEPAAAAVTQAQAPAQAHGQSPAR